MPEPTREEKIKIFSKLPPQLQEMMFSDATADTIDRIGKKYTLNDNQISLLARTIGDVILKIKQVASLAQEISSNILPNPQAAMSLAKELYTDVLAPALSPLAANKVESPTTSTDRYRESAYADRPATGSPGVVDLRKATPPPILPKPAPIPAKPVPPPPTPPPTIARPPIIVRPPVVAAPIAPKSAPATVQRPPIALPLLEAEPHKSPIPVPAPLSRMPQVILRSPGLPPTDLPRDILDLRKDKGEF